eukprot:7967205-Alexandrium_andersonii.AAC.1
MGGETRNQVVARLGTRWRCAAEAPAHVLSQGAGETRNLVVAVLIAQVFVDHLLMKFGTGYDSAQGI